MSFSRVRALIRRYAFPKYRVVKEDRPERIKTTRRRRLMKPRDVARRMRRHALASCKFINIRIRAARAEMLRRVHSFAIRVRTEGRGDVRRRRADGGAGG